MNVNEREPEAVPEAPEITSRFDGHTPGPWNFDENNTGMCAHAGYGIYDRDFQSGREIVHVLCSQAKARELGDEAIEANARLIAAAPELLSLLRKIVSEAQEWVSVETALPPDMEEVEAWWPAVDDERFVVFAQYGPSGWRSDPNLFGEVGDTMRGVPPPTHWRPLPSAPVSGKSAISEAKEFLEKR